MNQFIHPALLADSATQNKMQTVLMKSSTMLIKQWLALTERSDYRQTYQAVQDEFVTLCLLESRLYGLLELNGLPEDIRHIATDYLTATEEHTHDIGDIVKERWPDPDAASEDALKTRLH